MVQRRNLRKKFLKRSKERLEEELSGPESMVSKLRNFIDDFDSVISLVYENLSNIYSLKYPDLGCRTLEEYVAVVEILESGESGNALKKELSKVVGSARANKIASLQPTSSAPEIGRIAIEICSEIRRLMELKRQMESRELSILRDIAPNMLAFAGQSITASIFRKVGSLRKIALLPASAIQVIGAEKALFRHLRNKRVKPPKHGIIFKSPLISRAPRKLRGKIARAFATKLSMAARIDFYSKEDRSEMLKREFQERYDEIMSPPNRKKGR